MADTTPIRPAPLACDECRRKHLRCKGGVPCPRCSLESFRCAYTPSRRGLARRKHGLSDTRTTPVPAGNTVLARARAPASPPESLNTAGSSPAGWRAQGSGTATVNIFTGGRGDSLLPDADDAKCIALYYSHFHEAHPVLVPQTLYASHGYPPNVHLVVTFIGVQYAESSSSTLDESLRASMNPIDETQASSVQALLLYAIVLHALHRTNEAEDCLGRAANIARHIGMNDPAFASNAAGGNLEVEESYRRTWWELHTTDIYVAALHRRVAPSTAMLRTMPQLPGLSGQYHNQSLQSFENRVFALGPRVQYPSACYKIEASRIISRILSLDPTHATHISDVEAVDHAIASWRLYGPSEQTCVDSHGDVDESLFQAHYLMLCASIFLHFPRSALPPRVPSAGDIACARAQAVEISSPAAAHHTAKAIAASTAIANLAALPFPLDRHSPFFVCGLVLGTVVQLAAATLHLHDPSQLQRHRDHVVLMLGALGHLGERWTVARIAVACLKAISQVIFVDPTVTTMSQQPHAIPAQFENFSNIDWLDMFTPDEIQGTVWNG